jgi:hypothetical protein
MGSQRQIGRLGVEWGSKVKAGGMAAKTKIRYCAIFVGVLLLVGWMWVWVYQLRKNILPHNVVTIDQYLASMPAPVSAYRCQLDGQPYYILRGPKPSWPVVPPSGPPQYVFDQHGHIVDWSRDVGDDDLYAERWSRAVSRTPVTVEDAIRALRGT